MSKPNRKRYKLSEVVTEVQAEHPPIEIETDDGEVFEVLPPQLWSDATLTEVVKTANEDPVGTARLIIGERYDEFVEAGGSALLLLNLIERETDMPMGKS